MATYGEETVELIINKGLWLSNTPESIPDGYCTEFTNVLVDETGNVVPRGTISAVSNIGTNSSQIQRTFSASSPPRSGYIYVTPTNSYKPTGGIGTNNPCGVVGATKQYWNVTRNQYPTYEWTNATTLNWEVVVGYRDRVYTSDSTGVVRCTAWNFPVVTGLQTETLLATSPTALSGMFFFKSRIFGWYENRVHFTDEATAGGYPETWNTATNFFDLPTDGGPFIWNMFVLNNIIYMFTADGVYTLQVYGAPANWIVKKLNSEIVTGAQTDSCLSANNIMYYCDGFTVFAYNGERTVDIGNPIKNALRAKASATECLGYAVHAFERGILLSVQQQTNVPLGGLNSRFVVNSSQVYYFDGNVWSQFTFQNSAVFGIARTFNIVNDRMVGTNRVNVVTHVELFFGSAYNTITVGTYYYDPDVYTDSYDCIIKVPLKETTFKERFIKHGYLDLYTKITSIFKSDVSQGISTAEDTLTITPVGTDFNYSVRFKTPGVVRRLSLKFRIAVPGDGNTFGTFPFQIKKIFLNLNSARKEPDSVSS